MRQVILYRQGVNPDEDSEEIQAAKEAGFSVVHLRTEIKSNDLVIGRYSVLPFYHELEKDVANQGGKLINTFRQHQFIADMREWCETLKDFTPKLYARLQDLPEVGPFVLKGQTNSKKHQWNTHMYAVDKRSAGGVYSRLRDDMFLADQEIYARDYIPLKRLTIGMNGLPIAKEFRFFILNKTIICGSFYWASHTFDLESIPDVAEVPDEFLQQVISLIGDKANFYVLDVAQTENGNWIVIELNDGQMSGLSCNTPESLYVNLFNAFIKLSES
jgi:hypothetical protein